MNDNYKYALAAGLINVVGIFIAMVASALIMAAATPDAPLSIEGRMWYAIIGGIGMLAAGVAIGISASYSKDASNSKSVSEPNLHASEIPANQLLPYISQIDFEFEQGETAVIINQPDGVTYALFQPLGYVVITKGHAKSVEHAFQTVVDALHNFRQQKESDPSNTTVE